MVSKWTTWDLVIATEQVEVQRRPWKTMFKGVASPMNTELKAAGSPGFFVWMITQHVSTSFPASLFILCCIFDPWIPATFTNFHLSNGPTKIDKLHLHSSMLAACFVGCMIGTTTSPRAVASQRNVFSRQRRLCVVFVACCLWKFVTFSVGICGLDRNNLHLPSLGFCGKHVTPSCICCMSPWLPQNCCRTEPGAVLSRSQWNSVHGV